MRRKARIPYESKIAAVEAYERHEGSMQTIAERFGISSRHVLRDWIHMKAGDVLYLPKGIENADYYVDVIENFQCYNVYFDTDEEMPQEALRIPTSKYELRNLYKRLCTVWLAKRDGYYYKAMQNVYRILELLRKSNQQYMSSANFEYLEAAEEYIAKNYYKPRFKCDKLHELSGLSYSYFNKIFNEKYGMPPVKYVTHLKIRRACELLTTGTFTLEQISEMCGFENVYYFSTIFKKIWVRRPVNSKI